MCRNRASSPRLRRLRDALIYYFALLYHLVAEVAAETAAGVKVYLTAQNFGEFSLQTCETKARGMSGLELYKDVYVAVWTKVFPYCRPKDGQPHNTVTLADPLYLCLRNLT